jgi:hypothetical protein
VSRYVDEHRGRFGVELANNRRNCKNERFRG